MIMQRDMAKINFSISGLSDRCSMFLSMRYGKTDVDVFRIILKNTMNVAGYSNCAAASIVIDLAGGMFRLDMRRLLARMMAETSRMQLPM